jgi:DNA primase
VLLFDADTAGDTAVDRAVELFLQQPVEIAIASMPDGVDPDEFLMEHGPEAFDALLANASDALTYKWKQLQSRLEGNDDITARGKAVDQYISVIAGARGQKAVDPLRWGAILLRLAKHTGLSAEELNNRFKRDNPKPKFSPTSSQNVVHNGDGDQPPQRSATRRGPLTAQDRAEQWILGILLNEPKRWQQVQLHVNLEDFGDPDRHQLAERYWDHQRHEGEAVLNEFLGYLDQPHLVELAIQLSAEADALGDVEKALNDAVAHLMREKKRLAERQLVADLRRTPDQPGEAASEIDLLRQVQENARNPDMRRV